MTKSILIKLSDKEHIILSQKKGAKSWKKALAENLVEDAVESKTMGLVDVEIGGDKNSKKTTKPKKRARGGGNRAPHHSINEDRSGQSTDPPQGIHTTGETGGEPQGPTGNTQSTGIKFIGGKKHMGKKGEKPDQDPEEKEYECPHCHHEFNEKSDKCPSCGGTLSGYED